MICMRRFWLLLVCLLTQATTAVADNCFTIYDANNQVVYQSTEAPIDLSRPISEEMARRFPGHFLVMALDTGYCREVADISRFASPAVATIGDAGIVRTEPTAKPPARPPMETNLFQQAEPLKSSVLGAEESPQSGYSYYRPSANKNQPGTEVHVRSYTRADGTVVQSHTRASPGRGGGRR